MNFRHNTKYTITMFRKIAISILAILAFLVVGFLGAAGYEYYRYYKFRDYLEQFSMLVHLQQELFQERGVSALYIAKGGRIDSEIMSSKREKTDGALARVVEYYSSNSSYYEKLLGGLRDIISIRGKIDTLKVGYDEIFDKHFIDASKLIVDIFRESQDYCTNQDVCQVLNALVLDLTTAQIVAQKRDYPILSMLQHRSFSLDEARVWFRIISDKDDYSQIIKDREIRNKMRRTRHLPIDETQTLNQAYSLPNSIDMDVPNWNIIFKNQLDEIYDQSFEMIEQIRVLVDDVDLLYKIWLLAALVIFGWYCFSFIYIKKRLEYLKQNAGNVARVLDEITELAYDEGLNLAGENMQNLRLRILEILRLQSKNMQNKQKNAFLANISHRLKDPLGNIIGFTDLLKESKLDVKTTRFANNIKDSTEELLKIINNVIEISRIESKNIAYEPESITPLIRFGGFLEIGMKKARDLDSEVKIIGYIDPWIVHNIDADLPKLRDICETMVDNSINAIDKENGIVFLKIEQLKSDQPNKILLRFSVEDNGRGMNKQVVNKLFDDFTKVDVASKIYDGKGLGLGIAAKYVEMMGSKIDVVSKPGVGSKFSFDLYFDPESSSIFDYKDKFEALKIEIIEPNPVEFNDEPKQDTSELSNLNYDALYYKFLTCYLDYMGIKFEFCKEPSGENLVYTRHLNLARDGVKTIYASNSDEQVAKPDVVVLKEPFDIIKLSNCIESVKEAVKKTMVSKLNLGVLYCGDDRLGDVLKEVCLNVSKDAATLQKIDFAFLDLKSRIQPPDGIEENGCYLIEVLNKDDKLTKGYKWTDFVKKPLTKDKIIDVISHTRRSAMLTNQNLRDILLFKKSVAANNIYASSMRAFCPKIDSVLSIEELREALNTNPYKLVLIDYDVPNFQANLILEWVEAAKDTFKINTKIGIFINSKNSVGFSIDGHFDAVIESILNIQQLEQIIERII